MKYKDIAGKYDLTKAEFDTVIKITDYLNKLDYYDLMEEMDKAGDDQTRADLVKKASERFDATKIAETTYFTNDQVLLFKELYENHGKTFVKKDVAISDEAFKDKFSKIKDINGHVNFFKDRMKNNVSNEQLNKTVARFVSVDISNGKYKVEIIPVNFLEGLMVSYIKYHMFIEDRNRHIKREIKNILKNSKLTFDEENFGKMYENFKTLLDK